MTFESVLIRLFGSVEVLSPDGWCRGGPSKQACVLASLALAPRTPIGIDVLAHRIWGSEPPAGMRNVVYGHITRLRRLFDGNDAVELRRVGPSEYQLDIASDLVDVLRARTLAAEAREEEHNGEAARAAEHWRLAADLWRGPALAGVRGAWALRTARKLRDEHVAVLAGLSECELSIGRHEALVPRLQTAVEEYPLAENLVEALMLALYRCGRGGEALDRYEDTRRRLRDELGNDPGQRLRDLQQRILRQDPDLFWPAAPVGHPASARERAASDRRSPAGSRAPAVPAQLPAALGGFVGREDALARLDSLAPGGDGVRIATISGMAGVGKTALALHWAHRIARWFPDGQLYANLRGFDRSEPPVEPAEVLRGFLYALGVAPQAVPPGFQAQLGLFRTTLTGKRMLLVLDNARDENQVRPLLPGAPGCTVAVTSRNRLPGLVTTHGARPVLLDVFSDSEAHRLLELRLGASRIAAEPEAVAETVSQSGRLPLALAVVAARAATLPEVRMTGLLHELRNARTALDGFATTDATTDVRAVFSWSYRLLGSEAAGLFRLLGLHPGPDISLAAAASLAGLDDRTARTALAELGDAHLLVEHAPGRYFCHDLLRAYAAELVRESGDDRVLATVRLLAHYGQTAHTAASLLDPVLELGSRPPAVGRVRSESLRTLEDALSWFRTEHAVLSAVLDLAVAARRDPHAGQLAAALVTFLDRQGCWYELAETQRIALTVAQRLGDQPARARAHRHLGRAYLRLRRFEDAHEHVGHALEIYRALEDLRGLSMAHRQVAALLSAQGRYDEALPRARLVLAYSESVGDDVTLALAYNSLGWNLAQLGRHAEAIGPSTRALEVARRSGDREVEASVWDSLGYVNHHLGNHARAVGCYRKAIELRHRLGDRRGEAASLAGFGDMAKATGESARAAEAWRQALVIYEDLHDPAADAVRAKLRPAPG